MDDLRRRFAQLEFPAPDLWADIEAREAGLESQQAPARFWAGERLSPMLFGVLAVLLTVATLAAVGVGVGRLRLPSIITPPPSETASAAPTSSAEEPVPSPRRTTGVPVQSTWTGPLRTDTEGALIGLSGATSDGADPQDAAVPLADITSLAVNDLGNDWDIGLAGSPTAGPGPAEAVTSYGLVFDTDEDGFADYVMGIDDGTPSGDYRVWITILATGETIEQVGPPYGDPVEFSHPEEGVGEDPPIDPQMVFTFLPGRGLPGTDVSRTTRFYAWASVTEGGEVVSWDYAPDADWFVAPPIER